MDVSSSWYMMELLVTNVLLITMICGHRQQLKCSILLGFSLLLGVGKLNFDIVLYAFVAITARALYLRPLAHPRYETV